jgi:hypothetical protein|tara:strand:- start:1643 stop:2143 length:501 start_codon:yes stop_codon:yes gene_type:complete
MPHINGDNKKGHWQPFSPDQYKGKQLIGKSQGRILLDSGDDSYFISNNGMLFTTNGEIHFNTKSSNPNCMFMVDSPRIQLGIDSGGTTIENAAVKSNELIEKLKEILAIIENMYNVDLLLLAPIAPPIGPCAPDATFPSKVQATKTRIESLKNSLDEIKSNKVFLT